MPTPANNNGTLSAFANEGLYSATKNFMFFSHNIPINIHVVLNPL